MNVNELATRLLRSGLCVPSRLIGCTNLELADIEHHIGHRLPAAYKALMDSAFGAPKQEIEQTNKTIILTDELDEPEMIPPDGNMIPPDGNG